MLLSRQGATLSSLSHEDLLEAKQLGYSDIQISQRMGVAEDEVRQVFISLYVSVTQLLLDDHLISTGLQKNGPFYL